jgi:Dihydrodipicolinate synthetase family
MSGHRRQLLRFSGYAPALPTPFDDAGEIDVAALELLCLRQIEQGATALVACGTTGEAPTLDRAEHDRVVRAAVAAAQGCVFVIAGADSNSTSQAIELARDAEAAGADAILSVVPYYNKPTQAGMYAHFRAIAEATALPLILYDVPSRTVCGLADETVARLAELPRSSASRTRPATSPAPCACADWSAPSSVSCPATTRPRSPSLRRAATAASRSPRTWRQASAGRCIWHAGVASLRRRSGLPLRWRS